MPFNRIPEITALISTIDTAMARADDIGNDMIRDLMPDLRDAIDEINATGPTLGGSPVRQAPRAASRCRPASPTRSLSVSPTCRA